MGGGSNDSLWYSSTPIAQHIYSAFHDESLKSL